ncbi:hypothetical protein NL108_017158 [Boleophthalmus pectinirostris]|nr:hypothetical protein NL108_017158 [Boleophthalmus pectinirostris]
MKSFERVVVGFLREEVVGRVDPHQFAYCSNRSTDDALVTTAHFILKHLEDPSSSARILFVDFSSAFNTRLPGILLKKLLELVLTVTLLSGIGRSSQEDSNKLRVIQHCQIFRLSALGHHRAVLAHLFFSLCTPMCAGVNR